MYFTLGGVDIFCSKMLIFVDSPAFILSQFCKSDRARNKARVGLIFSLRARTRGTKDWSSVELLLNLSWSLINICTSMRSHGQINTLPHVEKHHISCSFWWNVLYFSELLRIISIPREDAWTPVTTNYRQVCFLTWHERWRNSDPITCLWK